MRYPEAARIRELEQDNAELRALFDAQRKRTLEADKLWQIAHNQPDTFPDLGKLIEWLLLRLKNQETVIEATRAAAKAKDAQIEQMREVLRLADELIDEYAAVCEHRDNVDEVRDRIKAAIEAVERGEG